MTDELRIAIEYAKTLLGLPYIWGGSNPIEGFDCSGLVQEILASIGFDPNGDQSAQGLYWYFKTSKAAEIGGAGALYFYGKSVENITHVAFGIASGITIEAGGGDHTCVDRTSASKKNAFVRIRHYMHRSDLIAVLMPNYI